MPKATMKLIDARLIADELLAALSPLCGENRCVVAGSVRRKVERPGDIEIVCLPKTGNVKSPGEMFPCKQNLVIHWMNTQHHRRHGIKIVKGGPRYHQIIYGSTQVDIFMPLPRQWGRILALRTGPVAYAKEMAARWKFMGYKGIKGELIKVKTKLGINTPTKPEFPSEKSFFDFLGCTYIKPENRG